MALTSDHHRTNSSSEVKLFRMCPIWSTLTATNTTSSSPSSTHNLNGESLSDRRQQRGGDGMRGGNKTVKSVARSILPARKRLKLEPLKHLYFPYEPGKQVRSAIRLKNTTKSHVAFKFQTTAPKSCYMRPPGGILAPGESLIATVFKFVEHPENVDKQTDDNSKVKFKIVSLKVKEEIEYAPELFEEQKDHVTVERILRAVFLNAEHPNPALDKLKRLLAEAEAELEARKKPPPDTGNKIVGEGLVIDEWKERRERYLARQHVEAVHA